VITEDEVRRIAALAKLDPSEGELERMRGDLARILDLVDQLDEVRPGDTGGAGSPTPTRADEPRPPLAQEDVAANAPEFARGHFVVPPILGGDP
jgi:aspartyl-tRNA(Asn)/glutamyl-tRNA(Gln) amidotransferase subunit C